LNVHKIKGPVFFKETNSCCSGRLILKTFFKELKLGETMQLLHAGKCNSPHNNTLNNSPRRSNQQTVYNSQTVAFSISRCQAAVTIFVGH
jgi:hypothetical protein